MARISSKNTNKMTKSLTFHDFCMGENDMSVHNTALPLNLFEINENEVINIHDYEQQQSKLNKLNNNCSIATITLKPVIQKKSPSTMQSENENQLENSVNFLFPKNFTKKNSNWRSKNEQNLEEEEDNNKEIQKKISQKFTTTTNSTPKKCNVNRRGLPLNAPFSAWLQLFLLRKKGRCSNVGAGILGPTGMMRSSVSLCM